MQMKTLFYTLLLFVFFHHGTVFSQQNEMQLTPSTFFPTIDGIIGEEEWLDAASLQLQRTSDWSITILVTYDEQYIYVAFTNLMSTETTRLNAEIVVQTQVAINEWNENTYWFHSSYSNCSSLGVYYNWEHCSKEPTGWKANTYPFIKGNHNMEFKISFSKLQIKTPTPGDKLRIAFKLSSADENHTYWPYKASIVYPDSWGTLIF